MPIYAISILLLLVLYGETIEMININETTPRRFIKDRIGDMFLIE